MSSDSEHFVGAIDEFADGARRLITVKGVEVGVFAHANQFYAYRNWCVHQGGPVCEGLIAGRIEEVVDEGGRIVGGRISEDQIHLVCPWHGYEFNLETGQCIPEPGKRLRAYEVVRRNGAVYVVI